MKKPFPLLACVILVLSACGNATKVEHEVVRHATDILQWMPCYCGDYSPIFAKIVSQIQQKDGGKFPPSFN